MKNILILSALVLALTSCSKYQINVLSSSNIKKDPENGKFVTENDSVKITYSFFGRNAPINLEVYNKLNEPLYIDWQRSAFITDGKAVSYASDQLHITGEVSGSSIGNKNYSYSSGNIDAVATLPKTVVFVPPHTGVSRTLLEVTSQFITYIPDNKFAKKELPSLSISGSSLVNIAEFNTEQSPLNFRSYLSLYVLNNNGPKYTAYEHDFFVSKLINTGEEPANFEFSQTRRGDYFYTSKVTTGSKVGTGAGLAALLVGAAIIDAKHPATTK